MRPVRLAGEQRAQPRGRRGPAGRTQAASFCCVACSGSWALPTILACEGTSPQWGPATGGRPELVRRDSRREVDGWGQRETIPSGPTPYSSAEAGACMSEWSVASASLRGSRFVRRPRTSWFSAVQHQGRRAMERVRNSVCPAPPEQRMADNSGRGALLRGVIRRSARDAPQARTWPRPVARVASERALGFAPSALGPPSRTQGVRRGRQVGGE